MIRPWVHPRRMFLASGTQTDEIFEVEIERVADWVEALGSGATVSSPVVTSKGLTRLVAAVSRIVERTEKPASLPKPIAELVVERNSEPLSRGLSRAPLTSYPAPTPPLVLPPVCSNVGDSLDLARLRDIRKQCRAIFPEPNRSPPIPPSPASCRSPWLERLEPSRVRARSQAPEFTVTRKFHDAANSPRRLEEKQRAESPVHARHIVRWLKKVTTREASPARMRAEEAARR